MGEDIDSQMYGLRNAAFIEALGTAGFLISATPVLSLLLLRFWARPGGWLTMDVAPVLALSSLVLPLLSCAGCLACLASLVLMRRRWQAGWERALLGLMLGGLALGCWAALAIVGLGLRQL
jgi:hypothetical protein